MIISTNLTVEDMLKRYSPQIASRLRGSFERVAFIGEDIRLKKNKGV
jgi:DNA replication protein DnaC